MSYVTDRLNAGEKILYQPRNSKIAYCNALLMLAVLFRFGGLLRLANTQLALTDKRIIGKTGLAGGTTLAVALRDIESVTVRRSPIGLMLDYGTIVITDKNGRRVAFKGIVWPLVFQQEANEAIEMAVLGRKISDFA